MAVAATIDLLLGIAFIVAYHKTSASESSAPVFARRG
jgi:hypothetical protein